MKQFNKHIIGLVMVVTIAALGLFSCTGSDKAKPDEAHEAHHEDEEGTVEFSQLQYTSSGITLGGIQKRPLTGLLKVNGLMDVPPQNQVSISVPYGGILKDTDLLQGMWVKKGEVIARMEHPDYIQMQQDYVEARHALEYMAGEYQRQEELSKEQVSAAKTFQKTTADYQSLKSKVEGLTQKLALLNVYAENVLKNGIMRSIPLISPISGYVTEVNANIGKFVQANEVIFEIVDTRHLHVELMVFEKDVPRMKEGQQVRFTLANESTERLAEVHLIGREISAERTVRVHCHLSKEDEDLLPGMFLKATIETGAAQVDALPSEAIVSSGGKNYIFLQAEGKEAHGYTFKMIEINAGVSDGGFTEVTLPGKFDKGSKNIVLRGAYDLLSKMNNSEEEGHAH